MGIKIHYLYGLTFALVIMILCPKHLIAGTDWENYFDLDYYDEAPGECKVRERFASPFVTALYERVSIASGCSSREMARGSRYVHVISLRNGGGGGGGSGSSVDTADRMDAVDSGRGESNVGGNEGAASRLGAVMAGSDVRHQDRPRVTLQLVYREGKFSDRLVFVLSSERPVIWELDTTRLQVANNSRHVFYISPTESRLHRGNSGSSRGKDELRIKVKKVTLPFDPDNLVTWVRGELGAMTSYTEVQRANTITKFLDLDSSAGEVCNMSSGLAPSGVAVYLQSQVTRGCVAPGNEGYNNKDVHIIEVEDASPRAQLSDRVTDILVDITSRARRARTKHLLLLLKAHTPVRWRVHTQALRGSLHIIAQDTVDTSQVHIERVSTANEHLSGLSGQTLVDWTQDHYSPVLSYTGARLANSLQLMVDGAEVARLSIVYPDDEDDVTNGGSAGTGNGLDPRQNEASDKTPSLSLFDIPGKMKVAILSAKMVACGNQRIDVALSKSTLRGFEVRSEQITLRDESCVARENSTHFLLTTQFNQCDTRMAARGNSVVLQNAVYIHRLPDTPLTFDTLPDLSGSNPGFMTSDDIFLEDDEDYVDDLEAIKVDFECSYPVGSIPQDTEYNFSLQLYGTTSFSDTLLIPIPFPRTSTSGGNFLGDNGARVFVEARVMDDDSNQNKNGGRAASGFNMAASLTGSEDLLTARGVTVEACWLEDAMYLPLPGRTPYRVELIRDQCPVEDSIQWMSLSSDDDVTVTSPRHMPRGRRFSFVLPAHFKSAFVVCELGVCGQGRASVTGVPQCAPVDCTNGPSLYPPSQRATIRVLKAGPVSYAMPSDVATSGDSQQQLQATGEVKNSVCTQVIHVQGLSSATVVAIAFAAFLIGVLLMATLWLIHAKTGRRGRARSRFAETSGESTPSSTAPIAIHQVNPH